MAYNFIASWEHRKHNKNNVEHRNNILVKEDWDI